MTHWLSTLLLTNPLQPWTLDATQANVDPAALDALPWDRVFDEMAALEAGAIANPDEGRQVGHYWLRAPELAPTVGQARAIGETAEAIRTFAESIRTGSLCADDGLPFTHVLHIGIGGSALGPALLIDALAEPGAGPWLHFFDNTDPDGIERTLQQLRAVLRHTLVLVVSKSGGTAETRNGMLLAQAALTAQGLDVPSRMVAVTGEGSTLDKLATAQGWLQRFPLWDWVGGRTSVTSVVGLLPGELAGIDTQSLLAGARDMDSWTRQSSWRDNPAALLAGCWHVMGNGRGERAMVVLPYSDRLLLASRYLQQLVMESLGKQHDLRGEVVWQGLSVYGNKGSTDQHAYVQQLRDGRDDFFALFVQILEDGVAPGRDLEPGIRAGDYLQGFLLGTRRALADRGRPTLTLTAPRVDAYAVGGFIALFERAVGLYASLIGINAYHQPGVEAGKKAAKAILQLSQSLRAALVAGPRDVSSLSAELGADPLEIYYVLCHLEATGRTVRSGPGPDASWRLPTGLEQ